MSINAAYIKARFPEFATTDDDFINLFIPEAARYVSSRIWGAKTDFATAVYTAHLLALLGSGTSGGPTGPVKSVKVGDLMRTYQDSGVQMTTDGLTGTKYGQQFLAMRRSLLISPIVVN